MSESNSTPTGRVRRRASRQAGAPTDGIAVERTERTPVADATVQLGTVAPTRVASAKGIDSGVDADGKLATAAEKASPAAGADAASAETDATVRLETAEQREDAKKPENPETTENPAAIGDPEGAAGAAGKRKLGALGWAAAVVAVLSLILLVGSSGFFVYHQHEVHAQDDQRAEYVQTAKQAVLNLTNIKDDTAKQDIDRVLSVASGQLKQEYSERKDAYAQVVRQAKVKASGEIIETAVESQDDHTAKVLVAAKQTLTNAGSKDPQERYYRFRVTVNRDDSGTITASQVEFVA